MSLFRKLVGIFQAAGVALRKRLLGGLPPVFVEDVFSTWLYTGTGATQTITNGIDLSGKGGLVWHKSRSDSANHFLFDTQRGVLNSISSNDTTAQTSLASSLTAFNNNGFSLGSRAGINQLATTYVTWTFREQPKFFDVVTFSTNASGGGTFTHNLGSAPGFIIVKSSSNIDQWTIYHRSLGTSGYMYLNTTAANNPITNFWTVSSTSVTFADGYGPATASMVAYVFAHNAGGFGLTGTDNVISCGSYTGNGSATGPVVTLGYEPQWLMVKRTDSAGYHWQILDNMRGFAMDANDAYLFASLSNAEVTGVNEVDPSSTGFNITSTQARVNASGGTYIYIAIRRGPMKVPTVGTSVFSNNLETTTTNPQTLTTGFPVDLNINLSKNASSQRYVLDRLRGGSTTSYTYLDTTATTAEVTTAGGGLGFDNNTGVVDSNYWNTSGAMFWSWRRAPSFFDEVCYTGTGVARTQTHNLGVVPELVICKSRSAAGSWPVYSSALGNTKVLFLRTTDAEATNSTVWNNTSPTSSVFTVGTNTAVNASATTYVAYLFATCAGVSKVGSYTGTATTLQVDCGFTSGARFVLIKRTDSTGDWYVWDTARGIIAGNDPYLLLNSTAAEVTNTDYIDPYSPGFELSSTAPAAINASGGTFIFLAIA